ncbi:hypothetical protein [Psittacicella gerlachiana]|uniref:Uncharacterized protein n=1 Tax=Psittacicella gerlachiana TaxID=2028574 RepID=A0A3A1YGX5_9GAMM|nr:hypothetical protein [Psittacicella gerlachiana]RIY36448.1 hypothetical protein CKF59_02685 [Psittacicella gerlachiana]
MKQQHSRPKVSPQDLGVDPSSSEAQAQQPEVAKELPLPPLDVRIIDFIRRNWWIPVIIIILSFILFGGII